MIYYVYALIDPTSNNKPFYIGKGKGKRVNAHIKEASSDEKTELENEKKKIGIDISEIMLNAMLESSKKRVQSPKTKKIKELVKAGYESGNIVRIIAKNLDESTAFAIESFLIKTIYGFRNLTNLIEGKDSERFRPCNNLEFIDGFDSISSLGIKSEEQLKLMLAQGCELPLLQIKEALPNLKFEEPRFENERLFIEADIVGAKIRILTCEINIQIELIARKKEQRIWLRNHFRELGAENLIRRDDVFIPEIWKRKNMTSDVEIAIKRVKLLLEIAKADNREQLSDEALQLIIT